MSDKAERMGIPKEHILAAMILVRNLRAEALRQGLDPRAIRIAIIFLDKVDRYFAAQRLTTQDLVKLDEIAHAHFIDQLRKWQAREPYRAA